jgi:hypothetical protein
MHENKPYWTKMVSTILRIEMTKTHVNFVQLAEKLEKIGVKMRVQDLRNRFTTGTFGAILFVQCLRALEVKNLSLEESLFV